MIKQRIFFAVFCMGILFFSCKRQQPLPSKYLTFFANPHYSGSHPTNELVSNIYVQDKGDHMHFITDMAQVDITKSYPLHIHVADSSEPFGYSGNPVISLGSLINAKPVEMEVTYKSFSDFFNHFRGYYIVHDPDNINNDTTTLLIYGKIGNWK